MNHSRGASQIPAQLANAAARTEQAGENYASLAYELDEFLYEYVKGMIKPSGSDDESYALQLRHPDDSIVKGKPTVLVAQIAENLRTALDYAVFELSAMNQPNLNEKVPQFVIADSRASFDQQAKTRLRYLAPEQVDFVERLQPFNDNPLLALWGR